MTDASPFPVKAINAPDLSHASLSAAYQPIRPSHYHVPLEVGVVEDDGQISCICGFADDDGWTVCCDLCNRWQHQSCYYPQYDELPLPEEMQHYCVDCRPRAVDNQRARLRQLQKREHTEPLSNGVKRVASKSHKKKIKEPAVHTNGWPVDKVRHDRASASPRDQPPPAKRPKTTHRPSDSTSTAIAPTNKSHSRKRNVSGVNNRRSLSRSPDTPIEQYSEDFLHCHLNDNWEVTHVNLYNSIGVTNALAEWLNANEDEFRIAHKQEKGDILMRWDGKLDDIPGKALIQIEEHRDTTVQYQGNHPSWKSVTVEEPVPVGAYIGELKGHVGFKKDYQDESRWSTLRHPEPFVFFHPRLPLYIDARNEGTELRYVRRSCMPNARLQILVTDNVNYHFCFMATQQIEPGAEVAVGWDTADGLPELASRSAYSDHELELLSHWVSTALANCGPCACSLPEKDCKMSRFDRRVRGLQDDGPQAKAPRSKKRKPGQGFPPLDTRTNSRSGSEARKMDLEEDGTDSRSTSGSAGPGSASRDITPNTHYSANGHSGGNELSERERKKLAKEEEIFRRQEEEQAGKQAKKKRHSNGSNLNTPSTTSSKQLGFPPNAALKYVDTGTSRQSGLPAKHVSKKPKTQKTPPARTASRVVRRAKPIYADAIIQCDLDEEETARHAPATPCRWPYTTTTKRLLDLCARNNTALLSNPPCLYPVQTKPLPSEVEEMDVDAAEDPEQQKPSPLIKPTSVADEAQLETSTATSGAVDIEMEDVSVPTTNAPTAAPAKLPSPEPENPVEARKPTGMHLEMPPPINSSALPLPPLSAGSSTDQILQSPATLAPTSIFSPAVTAAVTPSPVRKKLSLSDYTSRRKAKATDGETKTDRESSPASTSSGPVAPSLHASSSSVEARASHGVSMIDDDVKMEDVAAETRA